MGMSLPLLWLQFASACIAPHLQPAVSCLVRVVFLKRQSRIQEAVSRLFAPAPEPEVDNNGESFISVSVRSDMDLGTTPAAHESSSSSFAGCVPQILPTAPRTAPLAALPSKSVHKLKPGKSCLVRVPPGKDHSKDYNTLPPFSYDTVRVPLPLSWPEVSQLCTCGLL
jgi:hypothetical protein